MKFSEDTPSDGYYITAYERHQISINGRTFASSLVIAPNKLLTDWTITNIDNLTAEHIEPIVQLNPELVLLGTGQTLKFPEVEAYATLIRQGIGIEVMDTGAACRTYNILMSEGRRVIAGLIMPD